MRRILADYFRFDVDFVMNITDVDDKIILAARQQYLFAEWLKKHREARTDSDATSQATKDAPVDEEVRDTTKEAL